MRTSEQGFTMVEMATGLLVMLVISAIAIPAIMQGWNSYRLTSAANSVAGILQRTRFEAVRTNSKISCLETPAANPTTVGIDENNNGVMNTNEPQVTLPGSVAILPAGVAPPPGSTGHPEATPPPPNGNGFPAVVFDARGTIYYGALPNVAYIVYLGIPGQPTYGYRAVTVTQMGQVKVWTAPANGSWTPE